MDSTDYTPQSEEEEELEYSPSHPDYESSSDDGYDSTEYNELMKQSQKLIREAVHLRNAAEQKKTVHQVKLNQKKQENIRRNRRKDKGPRRKHQPLSGDCRHLIANAIIWLLILQKNIIFLRAPRKTTKPGPKSPFSDEAVMVNVLDMIEENPCYTLHDMVDKIEETFDITTALSRFLKSVKITTKNTLPGSQKTGTQLQ